MHEKFTYKDGKQYGPYLYENKRVDGKVITSYMGKQGPFPLRYWIGFFILILVVVVLLGFVSFTPAPSTSQVSVEFDPVFVTGEPLAGTVKFNLKAGELVPQDARVVLWSGNQSAEFLLSEVSVQADLLSGAFFAEGVSLEGNGEGYGAYGTKVSRPTLDFQLLITSSVDDSSSEEDSEAPSLGEVSGGVVEQIGSEEDTSEAASEASSEEAASAVTGNAIIERAFTVDGQVSVDEPFSYTLETGQEASLVRGSVRDGTTALQDDLLSVATSASSVGVTTDYTLEEQGFGEEYLGEYEVVLTLDLASFDFVAISPVFTVQLAYANVSIATASVDLTVVPTQNASVIDGPLSGLFDNTTFNGTIANDTLVSGFNISAPSLSFIGIIPLQRLSINDSLILDTSVYFVGAENVTLNGEHVHATSVDLNLTVRADEGFKGAIRATVTGWNGTDSVTSNQFTVLVSSGATRITTARTQIKVGEPVHWVTNISLDTPENVTFALPPETYNITVIAHTAEGTQEIVNPSSLFTGEVTVDIDLDREFFVKRWFRALFKGITGNVVDEETIPDVTLTLDAPAAIGYAISYYTEAPTANETSTAQGKDIVISGPDTVHYTDVIAFTTLDNTFSVGDHGKIGLYWHTMVGEMGTELKEVADVPALEVIETTDATVDSDIVVNESEPVEEEAAVSLFGSLLSGNVIIQIANETISNVNTTSLVRVTSSLQAMPFDAYDVDGDGYLDYMEWVVPHLSDQVFSLVFTSANSSVPGGNITFEGTTNQFSHLTISSLAPYDSLVGYWPFDRNDVANGIVYDYTREENDATGSGGINIAGQSCLYGMCLDYDGVDDYLDATNDSSLQIYDNGTIMAWINNTHYETVFGYQFIASKKYNYGLLTNNGNFATYDWGDNAPRDSGVPVNDSNWHHVAVSWVDGVADATQLYVDGIRVMNTTVTIVPNGQPYVSLWLGSTWGNAQMKFLGQIDEVMVFNKSLNDSDILSIYQNQSARFVVRGEQETKFFNISQGLTSLNLSLQQYLRAGGTNISARVGAWDSSLDYNISDLNSTANSLVLYYNFDNRSAIGENQTLVVDRKGMSNGSVFGGNGTIANGIFGRALQFDGVDDYALFSDTILPADNLPRTVALWAKTISDSTEIYAFSYGTYSSNADFMLGMHSSRIVVASQDYALFGVGTLINNGEWHHLVVTHDGTISTLYVDGSFDVAGPLTFATTLNQGKIGGPSSNAAYWDGSIDEVMIFDRSLTSAEVKELYVKGRALWSYTAYQNLSGLYSADNESRNTFTIASLTTHILPNFLLTSDANRFYSPVLQATKSAPANVTVAQGLDTCTYSGSGNWAVTAGDNCTITSNVNLNKNNFTITGVGRFTLNGANISNFTKGKIAGTSGVNAVAVRVINGGKFVTSFVLGLFSLLGSWFMLPVLLQGLSSVKAQTSLYSSKQILGGLQ
ncbi:LamG domain-containing protein [Candidatus Pacearchaeota archaeon]|nr:LamG domain-containing protein [Candidatus Pacearchaeota archaeon]